jgi:hypothetical protein
MDIDEQLEAEARLKTQRLQGLIREILQQEAHAIIPPIIQRHLIDAAQYGPLPDSLARNPRFEYTVQEVVRRTLNNMIREGRV